MSKRCDCCRNCPEVIPSTFNREDDFPPPTRIALLDLTIISVMIDTARVFDEISDGETYSAVEFVQWLQREIGPASRRTKFSEPVLRLHDVTGLRSSPLT